jgi:hypothetical protein
MEMADRRDRHDIVVDKDMVAFDEVPSNLKQSFHDGVPQAIFFLCCPCLSETWPLYM